MAGDKTLRIFCFGDSLTAGYTYSGAAYHPYTIALTEKLSKDLSDTQVVAVENGMPGDVVTQGAFAQRFESEVNQPESRDSEGLENPTTYDWVIILGGTNDLALGVTPERIFECLKAAWDSALAKGAKVLALTVPECAYKNRVLDAARRRLNTAILSHQAPNYHALDLNSRTPYHDLTDRERKRYWDDGVHLTPDGYDWMGGHIADALGNFIELERDPTSRRSQRAKRYKEEDIVSYDEETGDPRSLSEGYVVVRMRDLD
ncbi:GDSL-like Lipase/Acylhydrolase [Colletotrichum karsti]|uniref:GDSL-like Lipase/Acylhydrolase n=1 Tax=Colletotrichum karsti TaxID=1095194 RepID=A0A9P6LPU1_9PEZI|nr:GDSL-like Lipase/Acylhydrolase [Colletotrichum karsti]KAF9880007.1 GDSL-like Lipase/Acylhydrolase [Colletotrichum karsti]